MKTQRNNIFFFKIDSVRTIRLSSNYVYFVYYYIDVYDSNFIGIIFSKT